MFLIDLTGILVFLHVDLTEEQMVNALRDAAEVAAEEFVWKFDEILLDFREVWELACVSEILFVEHSLKQRHKK